MRALFVLLACAAAVSVNADHPNEGRHIIETIYYAGKPTKVDIVFGETQDVQKYMGYIVENDMSLESVKPFFNVSSLSPDSLYTIVVTPFTNTGEFGEPTIHMFQTLEEEIAPTKTATPIATKPILLELIEEGSGSGDVEEETTESVIEEEITTTMTYPNVLLTTTTTEAAKTTSSTTTIEPPPKTTETFPNKPPPTATETFPNKPPTTNLPVTAQSSTSNLVQDVAVEGLIRDSFDEHSLSISWSPVADAEEYLIEYIQVNLKDDSHWDSLIVEETQVMIGNLLQATHYTIRVTAIYEKTLSQPAEITTRTDGSGFEMTRIWSFDGAYPQGGSGKITLSENMKANSQSKILVVFPCAVSNFNIWNGVIDLERSNATEGTYFLVQNQKWMVTKGYIGFNANYGKCRFKDEEVTVIDASEDDVLKDEDRFNNLEIDIPVDVKAASLSSGLIYLNFDHLVRDFGYATDNVDQYAFVIEGGDGCPSFKLRSCWGLSFVETSAIYETKQEKYFIQSPQQWWMHRSVGIQIVFDPIVCTSPTSIRAMALIGGDLANALHYIYDTQREEYSGPCA